MGLLCAILAGVGVSGLEKRGVQADADVQAVQAEDAPEGHLGGIPSTLDPWGQRWYGGRSGISDG